MQWISELCDALSCTQHTTNKWISNKSRALNVDGKDLNILDETCIILIILWFPFSYESLSSQMKWSRSARERASETTGWEKGGNRWIISCAASLLNDEMGSLMWKQSRGFAWWRCWEERSSLECKVHLIAENCVPLFPAKLVCISRWCSVWTQMDDRTVPKSHKVGWM